MEKNVLRVHHNLRIAQQAGKQPGNPVRLLPGSGIAPVGLPEQIVNRREVFRVQGGWGSALQRPLHPPPDGRRIEHRLKAAGPPAAAAVRAGNVHGGVTDLSHQAPAHFSVPDKGRPDAPVVGQNIQNGAGADKRLPAGAGISAEAAQVIHTHRPRKIQRRPQIPGQRQVFAPFSGCIAPRQIQKDPLFAVHRSRYCHRNTEELFLFQPGLLQKLADERSRLADYLLIRAAQHTGYPVIHPGQAKIMQFGHRVLGPQRQGDPIPVIRADCIGNRPLSPRQGGGPLLSGADDALFHQSHQDILNRRAAEIHLRSQFVDRAVLRLDKELQQHAAVFLAHILRPCPGTRFFLCHGFLRLYHQTIFSFSFLRDFAYVFYFTGPFPVRQGILFFLVITHSCIFCISVL